jgi:hypothetical protein
MNYAEVIRKHAVDQAARETLNTHFVDAVDIYSVNRDTDEEEFNYMEEQSDDDYDIYAADAKQTMTKEARRNIGDRQFKPNTSGTSARAREIRTERTNNQWNQPRSLPQKSSTSFPQSVQPTLATANNFIPTRREGLGTRSQNLPLQGQDMDKVQDRTVKKRIDHLYLLASCMKECQLTGLLHASGVSTD